MIRKVRKVAMMLLTSLLLDFSKFAELPDDSVLTQADLNAYRMLAEQSLPLMNSELFYLVLIKIGKSEHSYFETVVRSYVETIGIAKLQEVILTAAESGKNGTQWMSAFCMYEYNFPYSERLVKVLSQLIASPSVNVRTAAVFALQKHLHHNDAVGILKSRVKLEQDDEVADHIASSLSGL